MTVEHQIAYWATIELYRTFLFEDGPFLETIREAGGKMDGHTLSQIARSYSVSRTIPSPPENICETYNRELFAGAIHKLQKKWPPDTQKRAEACRKTASILSRGFKRKQQDTGTQKKKTGAPHSAVTKLIWFLEPKGWTVYDQYAAKAVLQHGGDTAARQERFYNIIGAPLAHWSEKIRPPLSEFDPKLYAERLIDKYLLITGLQTKDQKGLMTRNTYFFRLLPDDTQRRLQTVGTEIEKLLPNNSFPRESKRSG